MVDQLVRPKSIPPDAFGYDNPNAWKRRVKVITHPRTRTALAALEELQAKAYRLDIEAESHLARETCQRIMPSTDCHVNP